MTRDVEQRPEPTGTFVQSWLAAFRRRQGGDADRQG
jgi:hypothetical protein